MKRKTICIILILVLCIGIAVPAMAEAPTGKVVDKITIEIPGQDGLQVTLTSVIDAAYMSYHTYLDTYIIPEETTFSFNKDTYAVLSPLGDGDDIFATFEANEVYIVSDIWWGAWFFLDEESFNAGKNGGGVSLDDVIFLMTPFHRSYYDENGVTLNENTESIYDYEAKSETQPPDEIPPPPGPLDGADDWALVELEPALDAGLLIEDMFGVWTQDTSRLLAADAIVRLIEVSTGKSIEEIAEEKEFDMSDKFSDTDSISAAFLKASGISNGKDGVNYGPSGTFTRAQLVTMLGRMAKNVFDMDLSDYPQGSETFNDIPESMSWAEQYIGWAAAVGVTQGDGSATTFNPGGNLKNQQTGVFSYRAFDKVFSD